MRKEMRVILLKTLLVGSLVGCSGGDGSESEGATKERIVMLGVSGDIPCLPVQCTNGVLWVSV